MLYETMVGLRFPIHILYVLVLIFLLILLLTVQIQKKCSYTHLLNLLIQVDMREKIGEENKTCRRLKA